MDYRTLDQLRKTNPAWRLLVADNAPMIVSFLYRTFIQPNVRTMAQQELASRLADYLYGLREKLGEESFPRGAEQYLDDWASDSRGWLRKYYPPGNDEAHYDLTPPTERAMDWLAGFNQRQFYDAQFGRSALAKWSLVTRTTSMSLAAMSTRKRARCMPASVRSRNPPRTCMAKTACTSTRLHFHEAELGDSNLFFQLRENRHHLPAPDFWMITFCDGA